MSDLTTLKNFSIIQIFKKNSNTFYYERKNKMKKIISAIIATAMMFTLCVTSTFAAESWREAFVTRLMKIMSSDPSYNQVVLTDLTETVYRRHSLCVTVWTEVFQPHSL